MRENHERELQKKTRTDEGEFIYHRFVLILVLSLSLFMMRRIHQFGAFFLLLRINLSLLFFPSFLVVFGEEEEKRIDVFDFSLDDDDFGRRRRFVFLSHSLFKRAGIVCRVLIKSSLNNLSVMMNNIIKNRHRIHRLRRRLGISAAPERRFEEDTFFSQQQQQQEQECSAKKLL
jgi:hypothetical protein